MKKSRIIDQIPLENSKYVNNFIDVEVYYSKGGYSYISSQNNPRVYYISVTSVQRSGNTVRTAMFGGIAKFLTAANRYSKKQFEDAVELGKKEAPDLIESIRAKELAA